MAYNISQWKTKRLNNLVIPLAAFYRHPRKDWHPTESFDRETGVLTLECGCGQEIIGTLKGKSLVVTEFNMTGEGSGTFWNYVLESALEESTGELEAVLIWESGDTIERLKVKDGKIECEEIEL